VATPELTEGQKEIMQLIADGHTTREIADKLGLSYSSISQRKERIYRKLKVDNASSAVRRCWDQGWIK